jgi:hypothetical protein
MPSTFHLYQQYGNILPTESGVVQFAKCKYYPAPIIEEAITNRIFAADATADYSTFTMTGMVGYYDPYFGMRGVGSSRYYLDGSSPTPNIKFPSSSYYDTGVNSYKTGSVYVWSEHELQVRLDLQQQDSGGTQVGGTDSSSVVTLSPRVWTPLSVTTSVNGQRFLMTLSLIGFNTTTDTGKIFYVDSVQVEDKRYQTSFFNGINRSVSQLDYTIPKMGPDYTVTGWARLGNNISSSAAGTAPFVTLYNGSTDYAVVQYVEATTKVQVFKDDTDPNTDFSTANFDCNPGDLVFFALVNDGLTLTVYVGKDGGSLVTANNSTDFGIFDTIMLGRNPASSTYLNGSIENVAIHKKALSQSDVQSIFTSATPISYTYSQNIIFVTGGTNLLGSTKADAISGVSSYRYKNQTVSLDIISASLMSSNSGYSSSSATHLAYGNDVEDLELNGFISTGTDLTTATVYKVTSIMDSLHSGKTAFLYRV